MWFGPAFTGAKIALLCGDKLVAYRRDDRPDIPFPGHWDLAGGGREGSESPIDCALREVREEFGIAVDHAAIIWERHYPSWNHSAIMSYFFVGTLTRENVANIHFGDEGQ